ncbi:MAG: FtsW/RodA/SpoVE family cell cycle protein, partial [Victivallales bacterium]|nr:FtsW/RodA/SpoVE family cell cycle protein [Victivallales bacterium]
MIYSTDIKENLLHLLKMDKLALLLTAILLAIGVMFIRCAGMDYGGTPTKLWILQCVWIGIGFCAYFSCALADYKSLGKHSWMLFLAGLMLLALVYVSGAKDFNHRSVLKLPGINIQVSEPMKAASL